MPLVCVSAGLLAAAGVYLWSQGVTAAIDTDEASVPPGEPPRATRTTCVLATPGSGGPTPVVVWKPSDARPEPAPLILYAPGWGGRSDSNEVLLRTIASHGYIVVAFDDVMHDAPEPSALHEDEAARLAAFDLSSPGASGRFLELASRRQSLGARKVSRVLDLLESADHRCGLSPSSRTVDLSHVGMLGFSFGGSTAALAARRDPRLHAVVNMDGGTYGETATLGVDKPYLVLNSEYPYRHPWVAALTTHVSVARANAERLGREEYERQIRQAARPTMLSVFIAGSSHGDFTDALYSRARWRSWRPWRGPMIRPARHRTIVEAYVLAFFDTYLCDRPNPLLSSRRSPFPEVRVLQPAAPRATPP